LDKHTSNYTDLALIEGLAKGDNAAIREIYRLYQPMLLKWMVSRGGDEDQAYDVFQESLMVLMEKCNDRAFALSCKLSTYLFAVAKRIWWRKNQQNSGVGSMDIDFGDEDHELPYAEYDDDISSFNEKEILFDKLEQSLDQLGQPCANLLRAFYIEAKSMIEIATDFGYTNAENAKTQKYKCLNRLKKIFFSANTLSKR